jgi:trimethylamine--corrinoid protein Co-methyltransferase
MEIKEPVGGQLEILSRSDLDAVHNATVEVLGRLGVKVWEPTALDMFEKAGAETDRKTMMVRIPEDVLKETISKAPSEFVWYGRDPKYRSRMGERRVHFGSSGDCTRVHDLEGRLREPNLKDVGNLARITDYCENIHHTSTMVTPSDLPSDYSLQVIWEVWKNSIKTVDGSMYGTGDAEETIELAAILRGGHEELRKMPTLLGYMNPLSPMQLSKELLQGAIVYARYNQPMIFAPEALAGITAPATLAGLLVQQNAEVLSGIMVSQLANPHSPVLYGTVSTVLDMRSTMAALGAPEVGLLNVASAQLARYYNLPSRGTGGNTDSKLLDYQSAAETSQSILMAALAGMNYICCAAGNFDASLAISYEKVVMDNEICGMVSRTLQGISITDETLAVNEICAVGSASGHLARPFTNKMFRKEHYLPSILDRKSRDAWEKEGGKDLGMVAREEARRILRTHSPEPLDASVSSEIENYIKECSKRHAKDANAKK